MTSHKHKFIFVHIPKTAGTSIDEVLKPYAEQYIKHQHILDTTSSHLLGWGRQHVIVEDNPQRWPEQWRERGDNNALQANPKWNITMSGQRLEDTMGLIDPGEIDDPLPENPIRLEDYFKFTFVRNPWDLCVSKYFFMKEDYESNPKGSRGWWPAWPTDHTPTFREWILSSEEAHDKRSSIPMWKRQTMHRPLAIKKGVKDFKKPINKFFGLEQLDWITNNNEEVLTDFIGRFENLQLDFNHACDEIGIKREKLRHLFKSKHRHYREYYGPITKKIVAKNFANDIEYFKYKF